MRALLRLSLLFSSASLISACLFPGFEDLVCESDCGGSTATAPTGASSQAGSNTGAGAPDGGGGAGAGAAPSGGAGGEGGGVSGPCGVDGVLIDPPGTEHPSYCIDAREVLWADYEPFADGVTFMDSVEFYAWAGDECQYQEKTTEAFRADGTSMAYVWTGLSADDLQKPAVAMSWCEARIYCRSLDKDLCGGVDGGVDDGPDNLSQWVAACSGFDAHDYTYAGPYDSALCLTEDCPADYKSMLESDVVSCESAAYPGLFNMTGNAAELVDNCVDDLDGDYENDLCQPRGGSCGLEVFGDCDLVETNPRPRSGRNNYTGFRCCWPLPP